ncbi:hypothetical protein H696_06354, partial [Fonticula alba]
MSGTTKHLATPQSVIRRREDLRHNRGARPERTRHTSSSIRAAEKFAKEAEEAVDHAELLLTEQAGYLEASEGEQTRRYTQAEILDN